MDNESIKRRLNVILVLAIVDAVLLVPLLLHRFADLDVPTFAIGMTHGAVSYTHLTLPTICSV